MCEHDADKGIGRREMGSRWSGSLVARLMLREIGDRAGFADQRRSGTGARVHSLQQLAREAA